jgi:hypothetical protein
MSKSVQSVLVAGLSAVTVAALALPSAVPATTPVAEVRPALRVQAPG